MLVVWYTFEIRHFSIVQIFWHRHQRCQHPLLMWQHWSRNYVYCNVLLIALVLPKALKRPSWMLFELDLWLSDRNKGLGAAPLTYKYCRTASTGQNSQFFPQIYKAPMSEVVWFWMLNIESYEGRKVSVIYWYIAKGEMYCRVIGWTACWRKFTTT